MVKQRGKQIMPTLDRKQRHRGSRQGEGAHMVEAKRTVFQMVQRRVGRQLSQGSLLAKDGDGNII